jgi:predicted peptidase
MRGNAFFLAAVFAFQAAVFAQANFQTRTQKGKSGLTMGYRLFVPAGYDGTLKYPLVVALHGSGERGSNNTSQLTANQLATAWTADTLQKRVPHFVLAPQCPIESTWVNYGKPIDAAPFSGTLKIVLEIVDSLAREFSLDPDRNYVIGLSMGGYASWDLTVRFPERFAAAVPICGAGDTAKAARIKDLPVWAFHGDKDPTVNVSGSRNMIAAIKRAGGDPAYTEYAGVGHDSWTRAMKEPALFPWMLAQKRSGSTRLEAHEPGRRARPVVPEDNHLYRPDGRLTPSGGEKANPDGRGLFIIPPRAD